MTAPKEKTFNHQVYQLAYKRLKLSPRDRIIFQRLLGFLIRNDKPFPYRSTALAELTGYDKRTVFRSLNSLEKLRLIERIGLGDNRKFIKGSILRKIITIATNRIENSLNKKLTTATLCHKKLNNRDRMSYIKTSSSLKHKESGGFFLLTHEERELIQDYKYGLKHPLMQLTGEKLMTAKAIILRMDK